MVAADSARRDASKLSASSAMMTSLRLSREVEHVFKQHSLADTGAASSQIIFSMCPSLTRSWCCMFDAWHFTQKEFCHSMQDC